MQNSVFECIVDNAQYLVLKNKIQKEIDENKDSIRFYRLGNKYDEKIEHYGVKTSIIFSGIGNSAGQYLYDNEGNKIDFYHFITTLNGLRFNTDSFYNLFVMSEEDIDDMCGWAGDLQQLMKKIFILFPLMLMYMIEHTKC